MESSSSRRDTSSSSYDLFHYHQDEDADGGHRRRHHHRDDPMLDSFSSAGTVTRFLNGSNHTHDQPPSPQVRKCLDYDDQDCSELSFQLGMDPIERDWGDSMSRSSYRGNNARSPMNKYRFMPVNEPDFRCRTGYSEEELSYCGEAVDSVYGETIVNRPRYRHSRQPSTLPPRKHGHSHLTSSSHQRRVAFTNSRYDSRSSYNDRSERARPSTPENARRHHQRTPSCRNLADLASPSKGHGLPRGSPQGHRRFSSNVSASGSSVCSRSAPLRRSPIPRERGNLSPSLYEYQPPSTSVHTFESRRHERRQYSAFRSMPLAPEQMHIIDARQRSKAGPKTVNKSGHSSRSGSSAGSVMIDITPGVQVPLRGTQETYAAVSKDFYNNVSCFGCSLELCCIADVSYIVCPECKVVSPLEGCHFEGKEINRHGLGLGFTYDGLFQMQMEIMKDRKS